MSSKLEDEEYWTTSDRIGFSFDDEVSNHIVHLAHVSSDGFQPLLATSLFQSTKSTKKDQRSEPSFSSASFFNDLDLTKGAKPLENLVTKRSLVASKKKIEMSLANQTLIKVLGEEKKKVKDDTSKQEIYSHWDAPSASSTIRAIALGKPFSLHYYRSLELKSLLLDEAVKSKNGNAVLCVVLFLKKTLNNKLFLRLIQFQPSAVPVYINYLTIRFEARAAVELHL